MDLRKEDEDEMMMMMITTMTISQIRKRNAKY
jgi:hypothetical protein